MGFEHNPSIEQPGASFIIGETSRGSELQLVLNFSAGPYTSEVELDVVKQEYRILSTVTERDTDEKDMSVYLNKLAIAIKQELQNRYTKLSEDFS